MLHKKGDFAGIIDPELEGKLDIAEADRMIKVGLLCTNMSQTLRPNMSEVVKMLQGETEIKQSISDPSVYGDDLQFKETLETGMSPFPSDYAMSVTSSSPSSYDLYPRGPESIVVDRSLVSSPSAFA